MFQVTIVSYEDLSKQQQELQPDNGVGKEDANYIRVKYDNVEIIFSDAVEPEDATFRRDFNGIVRLIEDAYLTGKRHGSEDE